MDKIWRLILWPTIYVLYINQIVD